MTNAAGHPVADATIANSINNWTQASSAGTYSMASPNDTWTLTASAPGYAPTIATVTVHGADRTVNFVLQRSYSVSGHATPGSFVTSSVPGAVNKTAVTGTSGTYALQLPNGTWSLTATLLGYVPKAVNVTVHGANLTGPDITLVRVPASYKYTVRVMNGSTPIAYAWVRVLSGPPPVTDFWPTTPGPSGGFASGVLLNGTYTLEAVRGGFPNATIAATVDGSNVTGVRFSIGSAPPTTYALTVRVVGPTGAPIEGANVSYTLDGQTYELGGPTSSAGYTVGELTNGSYALSASAPGFLITHWNTTISRRAEVDERDADPGTLGLRRDRADADLERYPDRRGERLLFRVLGRVLPGHVVARDHLGPPGERHLSGHRRRVRVLQCQHDHCHQRQRSERHLHALPHPGSLDGERSRTISPSRRSRTRASPTPASGSPVSARRTASGSSRCSSHPARMIWR